MRLDRLSGDFTQATNAASWTKVLEKLESGEMPPEGEERPTKDEVQGALAWIKSQLRGADLAQQQAEGRTVLRRLNRYEYENTVHDLLAIGRPLRQLLPEDGTALGFDNIGAALNTSSQLLETYVEAADAALQAAILDGPRPETLQWRFSYAQEPGVVLLLGRPNNGGRMFAVRDDVYIMFSDYIPYSGGKLSQFRAPLAGRYRFRVTAYGHQGPVTMRAYGGATQETPNQLIGHYDLPAGEPTVVEFETELPRNSTITLLPYRLKRIAFASIGDKLLEQNGLALKSVEVEGPLVAEWPPKSYRQLFGDLDLSQGTIADAELVMRHFLPRAFRRPVTDAEVQPYVALVQARLDEKKDFKTAIRLALQAALCSPKFLFLDEKPGKLSDLALASRLSYFLWSSLPDEPLWQLASESKLSHPDVLRAQVERMLADAKSQRFVRNFLGQWLDLRLIDNTTPDKQLYPEFDELLQVSMVAETEAFFNELLANDLSVTNFIDSDFAMLNERLARHYGVAGVSGQAIHRVPLPPGSHRGGLLGQASILKVTANGTNTSPVVRGVWVLRNVLGQIVPPPPPDVPAVEPDIRGAVTIREQLAKHRQLANCASCHRQIDPAGFALENFDVIGGWRDHYRSVSTGEPAKTKVDGINVRYLRGRPVDAADELADGRKFADIDELKKLLLADRDQIARCVTGKLLTYATGGLPHFTDRETIEEIVSRTREDDFGLRSIVHEVVQSEVFRSK